MQTSLQQSSRIARDAGPGDVNTHDTSSEGNAGTMQLAYHPGIRGSVSDDILISIGRLRRPFSVRWCLREREVINDFGCSPRRYVINRLSYELREETPMQETIQFRLNNRSVSLTVDSDRMLLWVLRTELGLTGTKYGCGQSLCGACTVLLNNEAVRSCQIPMSEVRGKSVTTIEGLASEGKPHPLQSAFLQHDAYQCGFCTPGMILNAQALLLKNPNPAKADIVGAMEGNVCRCGSYGRIVRAIQAAAGGTKGGTA